MSKINIIESVRKLKPTVSIRVLNNHKSVYNICYKHFKNDDFLDKPKEIKKYFETRYKNIKSRKSNYYILKTICICLDKKKSAEDIDKYAKDINKILEQEKKKMLETIDIEPKTVPVKDDKWENIFQDIKKNYLKAKEEVFKFYKEDKKSYTIPELKKIRNLTIMAIYCDCFLSEDLYISENPPRRNEIRLLHLITKKTEHSHFNLLVKPKKSDKFTNIIYYQYKETAKDKHGIQTLKISKGLQEIFNIYYNTHKNIIDGLLFTNKQYEKPENKRAYQSDAWSKLLKSLIGYSCNDIRKAYVTKTYKKVIPKNNSIQQLAYRMGHTCKTAMEHYNQIPKCI